MSNGNVELRQRRPRQTANPIVSNKPDVEFTFNTSKLGVRVRPNERKIGLWVAAVTQEAPEYVQKNVESGSQIISVNNQDLLNMPFQEAVEHFAQLNLPVTVRFRPPLYPQKRNNNQNQHGGHSHHHGHGHHHHHGQGHGGEEDDDESDGSCFIACYIILFVIGFMFLVSVSLNGLPSIPTSLPSFSMFRRNKGSYRRNGPKYMNNMNGNNNNNQQQSSQSQYKSQSQSSKSQQSQQSQYKSKAAAADTLKQQKDKSTNKKRARQVKLDANKRRLLDSQNKNENENENDNNNYNFNKHFIDINNNNDIDINDILNDIDRENENDFKSK